MNRMEAFVLTKRSSTFKRKSPQPRRLWGRDWKVKLSRNAGFQACETGRAEGGLCQVQTGRLLWSVPLQSLSVILCVVSVHMC